MNSHNRKSYAVVATDEQIGALEEAAKNWETLTATQREAAFRQAIELVLPGVSDAMSNQVMRTIFDKIALTTVH